MKDWLKELVTYFFYGLIFVIILAVLMSIFGGVYYALWGM